MSMLVLLACARGGEGLWVTDLAIDASVVVLVVVIQILLGVVVAHSANVTSTVLQNVHRCNLVVT